MITVIIPTLDEERSIGACVESVHSQGVDCEVLIVDGGSSDGTVERGAASARVVSASRGRAMQMNVGAREASGDVLLFLHADTRLGPGALAALSEALVDDQVVGGGFTKQYRDGGPLMALTGLWLNAVRSGLGRRLVGTQGLFVRREVFERLGGFRELPLFEDVDFSDRLLRAGRVAVLRVPVSVSARRYKQRGVLRQIADNGLLLGLYRLRVSPARLARLYRGGSPEPKADGLN